MQPFQHTQFEAAGTYRMGEGLDHEGQQALQGFFPAQTNKDKRHQRRITEAGRLYSDALAGRIDPFLWKQAIQPTHQVYVEHLAREYPGLFNMVRGSDGAYHYDGRGSVGLRETMSVTDYKALFVDVLDRVYYGYYNAWPIVNQGLTKNSTLRDFRVVDRYLLDGVVSPFTAMDAAAPPPQRALTGPVPQGGSTPATADTAAIQYQPKLYQAMTSVNWRAFVNDDLGIFRDLMNRLSIAGNRGISKFRTGLFFDANGPHASLYTTGYANKIITANGASSNNPRLGAQGLMDGIKVLTRMRDSGGDPVLITGKIKFVYGPADVATAENLMNMLTNQVSVEGGSNSGANTFPTQFIQTNNWVIRNMEPVMDPYIPIVASSANGDTSWALVVDPASQNRPAVEFGALAGFEVPQLFSRVPSTQRIGGGLEAMMGSFDTMDNDMKIVGVFGGTQIDGRSTVASNGSGS